MLGDFSNAYAGAAADVNGMAIELVAFRGEQICPRDVLDEREVAGLLAVFVEDGPQIVEQSRAEDRDHARVGVKNRLARTVGARVTQRDGGNPDLFAPQQNQFFLVDFRQPVNGFAADWRAFRSRRRGRHRGADRAVNFPIAAFQLRDRPDLGKNETVFRTCGRAFAVNGLRGRDDDFFYRQILFADDLQHLGGAEAVNANVFCDLRHVATVGSLVKHDVDVVQRGGDRLAIGNVAFNELDVLIDYPRRLAVAMRLRFEIIQNAHSPAVAPQ